MGSLSWNCEYFPCVSPKENVRVTYFKSWDQPSQCTFLLVMNISVPGLEDGLLLLLLC